MKYNRISDIGLRTDRIDKADRAGKAMCVVTCRNRNIYIDRAGGKSTYVIKQRLINSNKIVSRFLLPKLFTLPVRWR